MLLPVFDGDDTPAQRCPWLCLVVAAVWLGVHAATLAGVGPPPARWGLLPDAPSLPGALTWFALHVHASHLASSLALLVLAAAPLECRWGSLLSGALLLGLLAATGGLYVLGVDGSERPLVGPSAALTGMGVAAIARFFREGLRFRVPTARDGARHPTFRMPAPVLAAVWFVAEVVLEVLSDVTGATRGSHYGPHAAAAVLGAAAAWAIGRSRLEARWLGARAQARRDAAAEAALAQARAARDEGRADAAFERLAAATRASPGDPRLVAALWQVACDTGRGDAVRDTALRFVAGAWQRGEREAAGAVWRAVLDREPGAPLDLRLRLALAPALHAAGHRRDAARTLRGALGEGPALSPGAALRIAELARSIHPPTGVAAARLALAADGIDETKRRRISGLIDALEAEPVDLEDLDLAAAPPLDPSPAPSPARGEEDLEAGASPRGPAAGDTDPEPEDPYALRLDPEAGAQADAPLELGSDGSLAAGDAVSSFGEVDLDPSDDGEIPDALPSPAAQPQPGAAGAPPDGPVALTEARDPEPDTLDPNALDPHALELGGADEPDTAEPGSAELDAEEPEALAGPGDVGDLAGPPEPRFGSTKVVEAVPRALRDDALEVRAEGGGVSRLALARVEAVSVVGVRDLGPKPVILIDLLLNWSAEDGGPLKIARLRSDRFDPRILAGASTPLDAVRGLAAALLERSGAHALPDAEAARGRPFAIHDTLAGYEREVLLVAS